MKKAKIKNVESKKEHSNEYGTTIYHNLEMDNGDKINIGKKKLQQPGWELIYKIVDSGQEYNKAKAVPKKDYEDANPNHVAPNQNKPNNNTTKSAINTKDAILYQSTMKEVMSFYIAHGFENVDAKTNTIQEKMDVISGTCMYLCQMSKANIIELNK